MLLTLSVYTALLAQSTDPTEESEEEDLDPDAGKSQQQVLDELTGQLSLFPEE